MLRFLNIVIICLITSIVSAQGYYDVTKYGVPNDSTFVGKNAIDNIIQKAVQKGGGTIYFPAGKYLTGPIKLESNITIFIDAGAELHFSDDFDNYLPMVPSRWEGTTVNNFSPFFYAYKATNITITGRGLIDGHGRKWWNYSEGFDDKKPKSKWENTFFENNKNVLAPPDSKWLKRGFLRPPFIQPMYCENVLIEGITIQNSPFWTVNPEFCKNVTVRSVTINNPHSPNTDGINPESCSYVHISDCHISVGDDCITIKSGKDEDGRKQATPAEDYVITNCTMLSGHGGVVIGSEMSGSVRNIAISNCIFDGTDRGFRIKSTRGRGGIVENIRVDNIIMRNIKQQAFVLDTRYAKSTIEPVSERTPIFRNIHISNVTANTKDAAFINGLEEMPIEDISFSNIFLDAESGFDIHYAKNISLNNVFVSGAKTSLVKIENSSDIDLKDLKLDKFTVEKPWVSAMNIDGLFIDGCRPKKGTKTFLQLSGKNTSNISFGFNDFRNVSQVVVKDNDVKNDAILK
ncbi:MAG: polygalacturonase [Pseudopedobacter saltans]|uniref:Polygalacturonase n=1 Tax=Pseudopedobacter saltans TaxID=151895 RepID=A0A2W5GZP8_9SPHI|nr:MAG: polygalacturonase [Pseudopedobacter saltans]